MSISPVYPGVWASHQPATDPFIANVALLAHFDNNLTNSAFATSGIGVAALNPINAPASEFSNTQYQFGGFSVAFNAAATTAYDGQNAAYKTGTGPYTLEWWAYLSSVTPLQIMLDMRTNASGNQTSPSIYMDANILRMFLSNADRITATGVVSANTWTSFCLCRDASTNNRLFVNGTQVGSTYVDTSNGVSGFVFIGSSSQVDSPPAGCFIDEVRVTIGVARYTSNYTPATKAFPNT